MSDAVIVALIGLSGSVLGSLGGVLVSSRLTQYRLGQLEKEVQKHNSVITRVYHLESKETLYDSELENIAERIRHLETYHQQ